MTEPSPGAQRDAEAAARTGEARLHVALEVAALGTFVWHVAEDRTEEDELARAHFGLPPGGTISLAEALATTFHPNDAKRYAAAVERAVDPAGAGTLHEEVRIRHADGRERWVAISAVTAFEGTPRVADRMTGVLSDITDRKLVELAMQASEERHVFLLKLSDALRAESGSKAVGDRAVRMIADELGLDRVYLVTANAHDDEIVITHEVRRPDLPPLLGSYRSSDFPNAIQEFLKQPIVYTDVRTDLRLNALDRQSFVGLSAVGFAAVPIRRGGEGLVWAAGFVSTEPRHWSAGDLAFLEEVTERTWAAIERARVEEALRASEATLAADLAGTSLLRGLAERLVPEDDPATIHDEILSVAMTITQADAGTIQLYDPQTRTLTLLVARGFDPGMTDYFHSVDANSHTACGSALREGRRTFLDFDTDVSDEACRLHIAAGYRSAQATPLVSRSGAPIGMLNTHWRTAHYRPDDRALRYLDLLARQAADLIEQRQAKAVLREREEEQTFLLKLSDTLRPLADAAEIQEAVARLIGEYWNVNAHYALIETIDGRDYFVVQHAYATPGQAKFDYNYLVADYPGVASGLLGGVMAVADVAADPRLTPSDKAGFAAAEVGAYLIAPLIKNARPDAIFSAHVPEPRLWTEAQKILMDEVAQRTWAAVERTRAETALRASETRLNLILQSMGDAVYVGTASGMTLVNAAALEQLGYADLDELDRPVETLAAELQVRDFATGALISGEEQVFARALRGETATRELSVVDQRTGVRRVLRSTASPLVERGRVVAAVAVNTDITAIKLKDAALLDSERRFRALVTTSAFSVYRMSPDWRLMYQLDGGTLATTADPIEDWVGKYILPDDLPVVREAIDHAIGTKSMFELEHRVRLADGGIGWVLSRAVPLLDDRGEIVEWFGSGNDVTERRQAVEALRASEARYQALFSASPVPFMVLAANPPDFTITAANRAYFTATSTTPETLIGRRLFDVFPDDPSRPGQLGSDALDISLERVLRTRQTDAMERVRYDLVLPGGGFEEHWWLAINAPLLDAAGNVAAIIHQVDRQTEFHHAEVARRESEERLRQFGEASQDVLWIRDVDTLQWTYLTPAFEEIYGFSRAQALSGDNFQGWLDHIVPADRARAEASIDRVRGGDYATFEFRIRRPDGAIRWMRNTDFPIVDDTGKVVLIGGIGHDFTEFREAELRFRTLVEGMPQLVWRAIDGGEWTWASPQWTEYTGQQAADFIDWGWLSAVHPDDRDAARTAWSHAHENGGFKLEYRLRGQGDGEYRWFQTSATPVRDASGNVEEWLGTSTDIHELRRLQESQETLLAELQHRVRNILAMTRSVVNRTDDGERSAQDYVQHLQGRISALARTQVVLTRRAGAAVDLEDLVRDELLAQVASADQFALSGVEVQLSPKAAEVLTLAVHELATNATKYGAFSRAGGRLDVRWIVEERGTQRWLVFDWIEHGVPIVDAVPRRRGFGTELLSQRIPYELKGRGSFEFKPGGLQSRIEFPLLPGSSVLQTNGVPR